MNFCDLSSPENRGCSDETYWLSPECKLLSPPRTSCHTHPTEARIATVLSTNTRGSHTSICRFTDPDSLTQPSTFCLCAPLHMFYCCHAPHCRVTQHCTFVHKGWPRSPMVSPARMERHSGFPAIIPTQERIVRVDVHDGEVLGAGFLLYFHEGLVLCVGSSPQHDSQAPVLVIFLLD